MRYTAADGISKATFDLDRNFGEVLVKVGLIVPVPESQPLMPTETKIIAAEGGQTQIVRRQVPHDLHFSIQTWRDGGVYIAGNCSVCNPKFVVESEHPEAVVLRHNSENVKIPADVCQEYLERRKAVVSVY